MKNTNNNTNRVCSIGAIFDLRYGAFHYKEKHEKISKGDFKPYEDLLKNIDAYVNGEDDSFPVYYNENNCVWMIANVMRYIGEGNKMYLALTTDQKIRFEKLKKLTMLNVSAILNTHFL